MSKYILINQPFALAHQGYATQVGRFNYAVTKLGYYVAAEQTLYDFPELFENDIYLTGIPIIELAITDFPILIFP